MRVLVAEAIAPEGIEALRARHEVDVRTGLSDEELRGAVGDYDALIVRSQVAVDAALIAAGPRLQVIGRAGVGVDNVDLDAATRAGITVVNAPTGNTIAAAEHTLALLLALARRVPAADASMRRGEWSRSSLQGVQLRGRTLGIIGLGKIGMAVAERARALGMTLLGSDPYVTAEQASLRGVELVGSTSCWSGPMRSRSTSRCRARTTGLIDAKAIRRMKPGAFVLNVARGGIVDERALADALREGRLGGAGIDVFEDEPPSRLAAARRPEHRPDAAPRRLDRRGPGRRRRGDRRAGARRARRAARAVRRQRAAPLRRGRADDRAVPAARGDPRPVPRPVRASRRRRRSRSSSRATSRGPNPGRSPRPPCAACSRP